MVAMATDYDCWKDERAVCVADVLATFKKNVEKVTRILIASVPSIAKENWDDTINELKVTSKNNFLTIKFLLIFVLECCQFQHYVTSFYLSVPNLMAKLNLNKINIFFSYTTILLIYDFFKSLLQVSITYLMVDLLMAKFQLLCLSQQWLHFPEL